MKQDVAVKWVEALRSGKYVQGPDVLKSGDGRHCCLGVLCEVMGMQSALDPTASVSRYEFDGEVHTLPKSAMELSGLSNESPEVWESEGMVELAVLNDTGKSFNYIADLIEAHAADL